MCRCCILFFDFSKRQDEIYVKTNLWCWECRQHMMCLFGSVHQISWAFAVLKHTRVTDFQRALGPFVPVHFLKRPTNWSVSSPLYASQAWPLFSEWALGAWSLALQEESGPELFPGGLDPDSDVVPTVICQQERGIRLSAWVWDVVCMKGREKPDSVSVCVCVL